MLSLRCLLALKTALEMHVWQSSMAVGRPSGNAKHGAHQGSVGCYEDTKAAAAVVPVVEESLIRRTVMAHARPWRLSVDGTRAVLDLLIVGVGYLL